MYKRYLLPAVLFLFLTGNLLAQEPCGLNDMTIKWLAEDAAHAEELIEHDLAIERFSAQEQSAQRAGIIIPVVVHVIHNGEAIGVGTNVSESRILSQLQILNDDFQRNNADASSTPSQFAGSAADAGIQFCLTNQDPSGSATNGITRQQYNNIPDVNFIENTIKAQTTWNSNRYLNIWVVDIPDPTYLGYSYLPTSTMVGSVRDGLVVDYNRFGFISSTNRGRTATHEIGHYLGLRHMWGNNEANSGNPIGCSSDDGISDTPNSDGPYFGCPNSGSSCSSGDMYMNYMDYTDDNCMNLFTLGQANVMTGILNDIRSALTANNSTDCAVECRDLAFAEVSHGFEGNQANGDWSVFNANGDDRTWLILQQMEDEWGPNQGSGMAIYFWNADQVTPANDYLFTPCLELKKNHEYSFSFSYACAADVSALYPEKFDVGFSKTQSNADFSIPNNDWRFSPIENAYPDYKDATLTFIATENKNTSIGFHVYSDADKYALQIDDIKIKDLGLVAVSEPDKEGQLMVRPNPTTDVVIIDTPINAGPNSNLSLYDMKGQLLRKWSPKAEEEQLFLSMEELPVGVFLLKWSDDRNHWTQRVVKLDVR